MVGGKIGFGSGLDNYKKELKPNLSIKDTEDTKDDKGIDVIGDMLSKRAKKTTDTDLYGRPLGVEGKGAGSGRELNRENCRALMDRLQNGEDLLGRDKDDLNSCVEKNIGGWTPDQMQMAKALLNDQDLTPEEKDLLRRGIAGKLSEEDLAMAKALSSPDEKMRIAAKTAMRSGEEARNAFVKNLMGKPLTDKEKSMAEALLGKVNENLAKAANGNHGPIEGIGGNTGKSGLAGDANGNNGLGGGFGDGKSGTSGANGSGLGAKNGNGVGGLGTDGTNGLGASNGNSSGSGANGANGLTPEQLKALAEEFRNRQNLIDQKQRELETAQAQAQEAAKAAAAGKKLTPEQIQQLANLAQKQKELDELQSKNNELGKILLSESTRMQSTLTEVETNLNNDIPSGFEVEYEEAPNGKIAPQVKRVHKLSDADILLGLDGKPLTPDNLKLINLHRKEMMDLDRARNNEAGNGLVNGEELNPAELLAQNGQGQPTLDNLIWQDKNLKPFTLTPDMRIAAVLLNMILVTDKKPVQQVRVKIMQDVVNPESSKIVIPKGSIVVGNTTSFDPDTGIMDLNLNKVSIGSGKIVNTNFVVASGDGTMGLKGAVTDTRGKYLLGAFVTAFSAGALNWFSEQVVEPFETSTSFSTAMMGASGAGGSEVLNKLSQMYASDLQGAARIYYVPKGVPLMLLPSGE